MQEGKRSPGRDLCVPGHVDPQKLVGKQVCSAGRLHPTSRVWERIRVLRLKHPGLAKYIHRALQIHPPGLRCCVSSGWASALSGCRGLDPHAPAVPAEQLAAIDQAPGGGESAESFVLPAVRAVQLFPISGKCFEMGCRG